MAKHQAGPGSAAPRSLIVAGVLVVVVAAAAAVLYRTWRVDSSTVSAEELSRVLIVAAAPDETGDVVGQIIIVVDVTESTATLEPVSPALEVTIPGTTYTALGDAYPFGGGAGTAEALARAEGGDPLPYVAIGAEALAKAVTDAGGIDVKLPAAMSVFDGEDFYTFKAGRQTLTATELQAVLEGAPYLTESQRDALDADLGAALAGVLTVSPDALTDAGDTNLSPEALAALKAAL